MNQLAVVIDTSVFMDYLNPDKNTNDHIDTLLSVLGKKKYHLCVDKDDRIKSQYEDRIRPIIKNRDEGGFERKVLEYWLDASPKLPMEVDMGDALMVGIKGIIVEQKESLDRIFVYVAILADTKLITNDGIHIVQRRQDLRNLAKKQKPKKKNVDFMTSEQAAGDLASWPS
jgi:hypothetical protein